MIYRIAVALVVVVLSGCSSGPSEDDQRQAVKKLLVKLGGSNADITSFKAGECVKAEEAPGYRCTYKLEYTLYGSQRSDVGSGVFTQIDGEWVVTSN